MRKERVKCRNCEDVGEVKDKKGDWYPCQECCPHFESDHFICLDCGLELDPGSFIDRAMEAMEDR